MYYFRKHARLLAIRSSVKNQLPFLRSYGLGDLPLVPPSPAWPVRHKVQSVRYQSDICSAKPGCVRNSCTASAGSGLTSLRQIHNAHNYHLASDIRVPNSVSFSQFYFCSASFSVMSTQKKVCVVGSGNWGSAIARIVGYNTKRHPHLHETVTMYVYEEIVDGRKLTEIINETHENVKYLPGYKIPPNVIAVPDLVEAAKDADILIFVVPHQFVQRICSTLLGKIKATACGLSLIKGFERAEGGGIELISHNIQKLLGIPVSVLMGANIAQEVAAEMFCETTIGCKDKEMAPIFQDLIQTENFRVVVVDDIAAVEVCGALKNVVAVGAGIVDGLEMGDNTKAAVIRLGLMEMIKFIDVFYPGSKLSTFFESCGVADLVTTCYGGRNRRVAEAFVRSGKTIDELEKELLNGQKLQGPITAEEVNCMLKQKDMEERFPLMTAVHKICKGELKPQQLVDSMRAHPEHMRTSKGPIHVRSSL